MEAVKKLKQVAPSVGSREVLKEHAANELVFAVVGHVGSGTSEVAEKLKEILENKSLKDGPYETEILKARESITEWAKNNGHAVPSTPSDDLATAYALQDLGDRMRESDHSAVARALVGRIRETRARKQGVTVDKDPVFPDGSKRAYILDSIRHPAEVNLLRTVYEGAFTLIGVVCEEERRRERIKKKFKNAGDKKATEFMQRDADGTEKFGQHVSDAFHLSDFFIDNTAERFLHPDVSNEDWRIGDELWRLVNIITHQEMVRPTTAETAMYQAAGASMRSACLSRQVGATLVNGKGDIISSGTNEVPKAGGGTYGVGFDVNDEDYQDERCAYWSKQEKFCSNTREQNEIIDELIESIEELKKAQIKPEVLRARLRKTRIGGLLEFSRAVHAEMDALLTAARKGEPVVGSRMFVTTFPCHYCARHLVAAGIDEVQYIEPYPKSRALKLHWDSIATDPTGWTAPSVGGDKVLFRPFTGIAPRLYRNSFLKQRELKDGQTGTMRVAAADWGGPWNIPRVSYVELEAKLVSE